MDRNTLFSVLVSIVILMPFYGCDKDNNGDDPKEQLAGTNEMVESVSSTAGDYFGKCSSIEDLKQYLNDIKSINGVKDAYISGNTLFIEIQGWGKVAYLYPIKYDVSIVGSLNNHSSTNFILLQIYRLF